MAVTLREVAPADAEACGKIIYGAFADIAGRHGFPPDFPNLEAALGLARAFIDHPSVYGVVAEADGRVIGSNFLGEGDPIRGVGPITVDPAVQGRGVGRVLMQAVIDRGRGARGIRLLQDGFNMGSLSLYASLGFEVREPVVLMTGRPKSPPDPAAAVQPLGEQHLADCTRICTLVHGIGRAAELADAVRHLAPVVLLRAGRPAAYMTAPAFWPLNHGVAADEGDLRALVLGAAALQPEPLSFLLPTRQAALFRWCLAEGLKAVKPMTLMTMGEYREPEGAWIPSVLY